MIAGRRTAMGLTETLTLVVLLAVVAGLVLSFADGALARGKDQMLARPCKPSEKCTASWTLTSRLGQILARYETMFGTRDRTLPLLGIEFTTASNPSIWYPKYANGRDAIIIQLTKAARYDQRRALFQLAHEAFHLISPIAPGSRASVLEEGLATYFAIDYCAEVGLDVSPGYIRDPKYRAAYDDIVRLAEVTPQFTSAVKRLRGRTGSFSDLSAKELRAVFPALSTQQATALLKRF